MRLREVPPEGEASVSLNEALVISPHLPEIPTNMSVVPYPLASADFVSQFRLYLRNDLWPTRR